MATRRAMFTDEAAEVFIQASSSSTRIRKVTKGPRPMFADSSPEVFEPTSSSSAHIQKVTRVRQSMFASDSDVSEKPSVNTRTRKKSVAVTRLSPSFYSESDVSVSKKSSGNTSGSVRNRRKSVAVTDLAPLSESESEEDLTTSTSSPLSHLRPPYSASDSKATSEWETIAEGEQDDGSSRSSVASCRVEMAGGDPRASDALPRRIVRRCHVARFTSPYEKCTMMMQAGARRVDVARATARKSQLKDFNIRLKCSCQPKKQRPPTPEPEDDVLEIEPEEKYVGLQSDLFPEPLQEWPYMPAAYYDEAETQVECGHGQGMEVGDFDQEVEPHLSMLVGTAVQQAMCEVLEHDELRIERERHRVMLSIIAGDRAEATRLRNQDQRLVDEKKRRVEQFKVACRLQEEAAALLQELNKWMPEHPWVQLEVLEGFKKAGYLLQDIKDSVNRDAMTWIWSDTDTRLEPKVAGRDLLAELVENISMVRTVIYQILGRRMDSELPPLPEICSESSSECDFFKEEWEIKDAGWIDVRDKSTPKRENSISDDMNVSDTLISATLTEYLSKTEGKTQDQTTVSGTLLSWAKDIGMARKLSPSYFQIPTTSKQ